MNPGPKPRQADCHTDRKHFARGMCKQCYFLWQNKTPKGKARRRKYEASELGRSRACERERRARRSVVYGLKRGEYESLLARQGGVCAVCGVGLDPLSMHTHIDHDHKCCNFHPSRGKAACGKCVRGILCRGCNQLVGHLESPLADRAREYINQWGT